MRRQQAVVADSPRGPAAQLASEAGPPYNVSPEDFRTVFSQTEVEVPNHVSLIPSTTAPRKPLNATKARVLVPAVKRAFEFIELLASRESGLGISELHRALNLPLSSVANLAYTMESLGYIERDLKTNRYFLSVKLMGLANHAPDHAGLIAKCRGPLEELVQTTGLTGHVAVRREHDSMYVDKVASPGIIQISSYIGLRWPLHTSAVGKALLAFLPEHERQELLDELPLTKLTARTITSKPELEKQFHLYRARGFAWEIDEGEVGVACVAAPIFGVQGRLVAAISLTGTTSQITRAKMKPLGALVTRYAEIISRHLGCSASTVLI